MLQVLTKVVEISIKYLQVHDELWCLFAQTLHTYTTWHKLSATTVGSPQTLQLSTSELYPRWGKCMYVLSALCCCLCGIGHCFYCSLCPHMAVDCSSVGTPSFTHSAVEEHQTNCHYSPIFFSFVYAVCATTGLVVRAQIHISAACSIV